MTRLMSVALTEKAVRERRKTVTRRLGWKFLQPGDRLILCPKTRGVSKAAREELAEVEVIDVRREGLSSILDEGWDGTAREGLPHLDPAEFVMWFGDQMGCGVNVVVTRIEWRYLDD